MHIEKCRLPKGRSFVLPSSALSSALEAAGIHVETSLHHLDGSQLLEAWFWPPRPGVPCERFYLRAGTVPSTQARAARLHVETSVIPQFIAWATSILALPANSPIRRSEQVFFRGSDSLAIQHKDDSD